MLTEAGDFGATVSQLELILLCCQKKLTECKSRRVNGKRLFFD